MGNSGVVSTFTEFKWTGIYILYIKWKTTELIQNKEEHKTIQLHQCFPCSKKGLHVQIKLSSTF